LFDGEVLLRDVDAYHCPKCEEEVMTGEQIAARQSKTREVLPSFEAFSVRKKVIKVGNSVSIPIPSDVAEFVGISKGGDVRVTVKNRKRIIVDVV